MTTIGATAPRWGFLGAGKMATSLIRGMLRAGVAAPDAVCASDPIELARAALAEETGIAVFESNLEVARGSDVLVLAVKPQALPPLMEMLRPALRSDPLVISIAAGVSLTTLAAGLGADCRLIRVMPNTPALVGEGASGYSLGPKAGERDEALVRACLNAVGRAYRVPEAQLDAVTGLSGSGPAFVYAIIEALSDGGVRVGLPREIATALAAQTVLGAARMVLETGLHTGALKDQVTSPGGTTIAGLHALERGGVRAALMDAVEAATRRSAELAAQAARPAARGPAVKLGLISDIHGDPVALELAWSHLTVLGADRIVCAGDLVDYGPFPDRVIAFLAEHKVESVRGNHDRWALSRGPRGIDEFGGGTPSVESLKYLDALPFDLLVSGAGRVAVIVHASIRNDMESILRRTHPPSALRSDLADTGADLLVVGHTHQPMSYRCREGLIVNPGSVVSMPGVPFTSRTFALVDLAALSVTFHDVETGAAVAVKPWDDTWP